MTPTSLDKNNRCYSRTELKDYSLGRASELVSIRIEEHLNECDICEDTIVALDSSEDTFVHQLRGVSAGTDHEKNSELDVLLAGAKKLVDQSVAVQPNGQSINGYQQIGEYELCELVGRGGMGQVYRARHSRLDKEFALKILSGKRFSNDEAIGRFQREMKIVGKLDHPSIVQATDAGEFDEVHYLTMEYVDGHNAAKVLHHCDPLAVSDACEIVRQACDGIEYAHQQDIVHRDIKPSNLMLNRKGQVKILDLGLATLRNINHSVDELTTVGQLMGTLDYMAPEQCDGQMVDHRCDIYSLGSTLYKLLTNRAPYSQDGNQSPLQKLRAMAVEDFIPITRHRDDLPSELVDIIHRCLDRDPENRYASAAELSEALKPFCDGHDLGTLLKQTEKEVESTKSKANELDGSKAFQGEEYTDTVVSGSIQAQAGRQGSRIGYGWIAALIMLALVPLAWLSIQIIINWDKGQLVIESETGNVQVKLIKDGKHYKEMSLQQGANSTKIRAGKYEILIDDPSDQLVVTNGTFELKRGGTTIAKVVAKDGDGLEKSDPTKGPRMGSAMPIVSDDQPTFEGWTLNEWLEADIKDKTFDAVERLSATLSDKERVSTINWLINRYDDELSLDTQAQVFHLMSKFCNDPKTANRIMDHYLSIIQLYKPEEVISGNTDARIVTSTSVGRINLNDFPSLIESQKPTVDARAIECLKSQNNSLKAFGVSWCYRQQIDRRTELPEYRKSILEMFSIEDEAIELLLLRITSKDFANDQVLIEQVVSRLDRLTDTNKRIAFEIVSRADSVPKGFPEKVFAEFEANNQSYSNSEYLFNSIQQLLHRNNAEMIDLIEQAINDPAWGWRGARSAHGNYERTQDGLPTRISLFTLIPDWRGQYMPDWHLKHFLSKSDAEKLESKTTWSSKRLALIGLFQSEYEDATRKRLLKIAKSQFDFQFNDHYLIPVGIAISILSPEEFESPIGVWLNTVVNSNNEDHKKRALDMLRRSEITADSKVFRDIILYMRKVDCANPDENELLTIRQVAKLFSCRKREQLDALAQIVNDSSSEDCAFLVWVLNFNEQYFSRQTYGRNNRRVVMNRHDKFASKFKEVSSPIVLMRGIELLLAESEESWQQLFDMELTPVQRSAAYQMFAELHVDNSERHRREKENVEINVVVPMSVLETDNPDDLYSILQTLRFYDFDQARQKPTPTEDLLLEHTQSKLVRLLIEPSNALMSHGELKEVDLWGVSIEFNPIDSTGNYSHKRHKACVYKLLETLAYCRFVESNFDGKKDKTIENIKSLLPSIDEENAKNLADQLIFRIENSKTITAYTQSDTISVAARTYYLNVGSPPATVDDLYKRPDGVEHNKWQGPYVDSPDFKVDPWGTEIKILYTKEDNKVMGISAGPDHKLNTNDDVSSSDYPKEYEWLKGEFANERYYRHLQ